MTARELPPNLTERQIEVLRLIAHGRTYAEIGLAIGASTRTAKAHGEVLCRKFGVEKKRQLIDKAHRFGFMDGEGKPLRKED